MSDHNEVPYHQSSPAMTTSKAVWRHPTNAKVTLPYASAAVIALIELGLSDYSVIAEAVGLNVEDVQRIDNAEDVVVRQLAVEGLPHGEYFKLRARIRCPKCNGLIVIAPCISCSRYRCH